MSCPCPQCNNDWGGVCLYEQISELTEAVRAPSLFASTQGDSVTVQDLDKSLGNIHECAVALEFMGLTDWALKLAKAHEDIQTYLINIEPLCTESPDGNHHVAPIGSDEEWMPSKAPCYYCGEKQAILPPSPAGSETK